MPSKKNRRSAKKAPQKQVVDAPEASAEPATSPPVTRADFMRLHDHVRDVDDSLCWIMDKVEEHDGFITSFVPTLKAEAQGPEPQDAEPQGPEPQDAEPQGPKLGGPDVQGPDVQGPQPGEPEVQSSSPAPPPATRSKLAAGVEQLVDEAQPQMVPDPQSSTQASLLEPAKDVHVRTYHHNLLPTEKSQPEPNLQPTPDEGAPDLVSHESSPLSSRTVSPSISRQEPLNPTPPLSDDLFIPEWYTPPWPKNCIGSPKSGEQFMSQYTKLWAETIEHIRKMRWEDNGEAYWIPFVQDMFTNTATLVHYEQALRDADTDLLQKLLKDPTLQWPLNMGRPRTRAELHNYLVL
ncbi:hypothetical protein T440DRAFT_5781 [Plenodomus tracheiphilus IPT5]|uniref:Uncharacterized protein n=1 Tax=Plenodomus tracheiphilus IPT5 TaxID=1408161 RepID=A0A6A7BMM3_9PLEO|nr:hypothetical protein T440DRAFT_5781 [Plenodomus tracheiphilus IPT5]